MFARRPCSRRWWRRRSFRVAHDPDPDKVWCIITLEDGTLIGETWCRRCGRPARVSFASELVWFAPTESPPTE